MTMHSPIQAERRARLKTPLGKDALIFTQLDGREGLSELFEYKVKAFAQGERPDEDKIIGEPCCVEMDVHEGHRHFHGVCTDIRWLGSKGDNHDFELMLRPSHWLLTLRTDSRIFKNKSVDGIIDEVLTDANVGEFVIDIEGSLDPIPYCVQYQETNFNFISRLMEKYGLFYFFEFSADGHRMYITNANAACKVIPSYDRIPFDPANRQHALRDHLRTVELLGQVRTDEVVVNAYNYERAGGRLDITKVEAASHASRGNAIYDYSAAHGDRTVGDQLANILLEAENAQANIVKATGTVAGLIAGAKTIIDCDPLPKPNVEKIVKSIVHKIICDNYRTRIGLEPGDFYEAIFELIDWLKPYRAPRRAKKPVVAGTHTATVVGEKGEEIDVDDQGRVLVVFHWDRNGTASCRCRVAQSLAGNGFGATNIPRIGHEVLVTFVDGDPDRPVVIGSVYNSENKPPIEMPGNKTQMGYKSNSSKGGGGANEILLEDKKGAEFFDMTAERDFNLTVKNDANISIGKEHSDKGDLEFEVHNDRTDWVWEGNLETNVVKGARTANVEQDDTVTVNGNRSETIEKDSSVTVEGNRIETVTKKLSTSAENHDLVVDKDLNVSAKDIQIVGSSSTKIGTKDIQIDGQKISLNATQEIVISCGASSIVLNAAGVTIVGPLIKLN